MTILDLVPSVLTIDEAELTLPQSLWVRVDRRTPYGNPFPMQHTGVDARIVCLGRYCKWLRFGGTDDFTFRRNQTFLALKHQELSGLHLACHCAPLACHADVLLNLARLYWDADPDKGCANSVKGYLDDELSRLRRQRQVLLEG